VTSPATAPIGQDRRRFGTGVALMLTASLAWGLVGPLAKTLYEVGWTPAAVIVLRTGGAALILLIPALLSLRGRWRSLIANWPIVLAYGLIAVAACQSVMFMALERLAVGTTMLIMYTAPVFIVLALWVINRRRPATTVLIGSALTLAGLPLALNLTDFGRIDPVGIVLAIGAMVALAGYFLVSERPTPGLPQVVLICAGLIIGGLTVGLMALTGLLPWSIGFSTVTVAGITGVPWYVPAAVLVVFATVGAYLLSLRGITLVGARAAAFLALCDVIASLGFAWLLLGETPAPIQGAGGVLILAGILLVQWRRTQAPPPIVEREPA